MIGFTISDRTDFPDMNNTQIKRADWNWWIRNSALFDLVVDVDKMFPISLPTNQADGVHFGTNCQAAIAKELYAQLISPVRSPQAAYGVHTNLVVYGPIRGQYTTASFTDFVNAGTNIVISPTNGNLQRLVLTNTSWLSLDAANTNFTESIRLNIYGSNTVNWTTAALSNSAALGPSNSISVMLFDHEAGTNLWWGYRLR